LDGDESLVNRARSGDQEGFGALVKEHTAGLYAFVRARTPDAEVAADLTQETFLRAWRAIGEFRGEASFRTWLYRIAMNLAIRETERRRRVAPLAPDHDVADSTTIDAFERLEVEVERSDLRRAIDALPAGDQELVRLLYQDRLSYEAISELLGVPVSTVKVRLHRARARLRVHLQGLWEVKAI
jgi:RNA polymerase sigma-70 factor, ECF subfamily